MKNVPNEFYLTIIFVVSFVGYLVLQDETTKLLAVSASSGFLGYISRRSNGRPDDAPAPTGTTTGRIAALILGMLLGAALVGQVHAQESHGGTVIYSSGTSQIWRTTSESDATVIYKTEECDGVRDQALELEAALNASREREKSLRRVNKLLRNQIDEDTRIIEGLRAGTIP